MDYTIFFQRFICAKQLGWLVRSLAKNIQEEELKPWEEEEGRDLKDLSGKIKREGFRGVLEAKGKKCNMKIFKS